jgi:acetyl-CoA carboxylase biotin carboxyl carrier protein
MTSMDFDEIGQMLELMHRHGLVEFELERDGARVRLRKPERAPAVPAPPPPGDVSAARTETDLTVVQAPILGTFYRASGPEASPFVSVGDVVRTGDVLCIIEAMKLMNEIKSDCDGEVVEAFIESGQPVQYGERLFTIRTHV